MAWGLLSLVACFLILSDSMQLFCGRGPLPVCRESLILRGKELFQSRGRERPIGVIALAVVATQFLEQRVLLGGLDPLGDDPQAEASRQGDGRIDDRHVVGAVAYAADERSVQFQRRSEEHTSELQSLTNLVCRLLLEKKKKTMPEHSAAAPLTKSLRDKAVRKRWSKDSDSAITRLDRGSLHPGIVTDTDLHISTCNSI